MKSQTLGEGAIVEKIVLEQVFQAIPPDGQGLVDAQWSNISGSGRGPLRQLLSGQVSLPARVNQAVKRAPPRAGPRVPPITGLEL